MYTRNEVIAEKFDTDNRINQLQEECAELICVANHYRRNRVPVRNVAEEMADVRVLMEQVMLKLGITEDDIKKIAQSKIYRTLERREWDRKNR